MEETEKYYEVYQKKEFSGDLDFVLTFDVSNGENSGSIGLDSLFLKFPDGG